MRDKGVDRAVASLAGGQHGVITTAQLVAAGLTREGIRRRASAGRLHGLHRGVYAVGHPAVPFEGRCLAAVLALGPDAVLSHRSAAELWTIVPRAKGPIHVIVPEGGRRKRVGLVVHTSRTLVPEQIAIKTGIPLSTPTRTLADLRRTLSRELHDRATRKAVDLGLISRREIRSQTALARSKLERKFLALCRRHRLPQPVVNARVGPYEVDFLWPEHSVIVETDGFEHLGSRDAFERDRVRDAELQARGYRVLRFTYRQVRDEGRRVAGQVRTLLGSSTRKSRYA